MFSNWNCFGYCRSEPGELKLLPMSGDLKIAAKKTWATIEHDTISETKSKFPKVYQLLVKRYFKT